MRALKAIDTVAGRRYSRRIVMTLRRRTLTLLLVAFAFLAVFAHICVLPGHSHAASAPVEHDHDQSATHDQEPNSAAEGVHTASCEALRSSDTAAALVPAALGVVPRVVATGVFAAGTARLDLQPTGASPPLYLAHRALLI